MAGIIERTQNIIDVAKSRVGLELRLAAAGTKDIAAKGELILLAKKAETRSISRNTARTSVEIAVGQIARKSI